jgi:hypothetical protein
MFQSKIYIHYFRFSAPISVNHDLLLTLAKSVALQCTSTCTAKKLQVFVWISNRPNATTEYNMTFMSGFWHGSKCNPVLEVCLISLNSSYFLYHKIYFNFPRLSAFVWSATSNSHTEQLLSWPLYYHQSNNLFIITSTIQHSRASRISTLTFSYNDILVYTLSSHFKW